MRKIFEGKRIFRQETQEHDRFLLLPEELISEFIDLEFAIGIPQGELLQPAKWVQFGVNADRFIPKEEFQKDDYEYVVYSDPFLIEDMQTILSSFSIDMYGEMNNLLKQDRLPKDTEDKLRIILEKETKDNIDEETIEVCRFTNHHGVQHINLDSGTSDDGITYEYTNDFAWRTPSALYERSEHTPSDYIFRLSEETKAYLGEQARWYYLSCQVSEYPFWIMKELHEIEDVLQFTSFQKHSL